MEKKPLYVHKTTKEQYELFKRQSKHDGELLYRVFINETGRVIPYEMFLSKYTVWLRRTVNLLPREGSKKINEYLTRILV